MAKGKTCGWQKVSESVDKQGGRWETFRNTCTGEKVVIRTSPKGEVAVFKGGSKVNRKT